MNEWAKGIQTLVDEIDRSIKEQDDEALTLARLSERMGYSKFYVSRQFRAVSGMQLGEYLRNRRLAFALREVRDSETGLLDIAVKYGFSSHEAFTRAFKAAYGVTPSAYRAHPTPVVLRTVLRPFDCYLSAITISGRSRAKSRGRTARRFAVCWRASGASWTTWAAARRTAARGR